MKKNKYNNKKNTVPVTAKKNGTIVRTVFIVVLSIGLFASTMYSVNCYVTKVCKPVIFEKFVRDDMTILMPKGALTAELANTKASRELGLSGRHMMKDTDGMLFAFDVPGRYGFWMKDMEFPLDIIWINENGVVVSIERGLTPESYTNNKQVFMNQADASYVLEVNAGQAEKFGLYLGSKVKMVE
jgi:uncharacterized membrane protein (UPF0127 family)